MRRSLPNGDQGSRCSVSRTDLRIHHQLADRTSGMRRLLANHEQGIRCCVSRSDQGRRVLVQTTPWACAAGLQIASGASSVTLHAAVWAGATRADQARYRAASDWLATQRFGIQLPRARCRPLQKLNDLAREAVNCNHSLQRAVTSHQRNPLAARALHCYHTTTTSS